MEAATRPVTVGIVGYSGNVGLWDPFMVEALGEAGNSRLIEEVFVGLDRWEGELPTLQVGELPVHVYGVQAKSEKWFGGTALLNGALERVRTPFLLVLGMDIFPRGGSLEVLLAAGKKDQMTMGALMECVIPQGAKSSSEFRLGRFDRLAEVNFEEHKNRCLLARSGFTLYATEALQGLGGWDEVYARNGYGFEDNDLGARWMERYGRDSVQYEEAALAWHVVDARGIKRQFSVKNQRTFQERWLPGGLYDE